MSISVVEYPYADVGGNTSKWNAAHHPIKYKLQREDYQVTLVYNNIGIPTIIITITSGLSGAASLEFEVGDSIILFSNGENSLFVISQITDPNTITVFNPGGLVFGASGFMNTTTRANYFLRTNIYYKNELGVFELIGNSVNKPSAIGEMNVDVSSFIKEKLGYVNTFDYLTSAYKDVSLGGCYYLKFEENWFEETLPESAATETNYFSNSSKQYGDLYGSNMGEYVTFTGSNAAKFLSDFKTPRKFNGFPFSLSVIANGTGLILPTMNIEEFDVNGVSLGTSSINSPVELDNVNRVQVGDYTEPTDTITAALYFTASRVTEEKVITIDSECYEDPIYLCWLNSLGGYSYYLFHRYNEEKTKTTPLTGYERNIEDLETSIGNIDLIGKNTAPEIEFGASIHISEMDGIRGLFESPKVMWLKNNETWMADNPKWQRVIIKTGTQLVYQTKKSYFEVAMSMRIPDRNTQQE
jgi:hypothetical protein